MEKTNQWGSVQSERDDARIRMFRQIQADQEPREWRGPVKAILGILYLLCVNLRGGGA